MGEINTVFKWWWCWRISTLFIVLSSFIIAVSNTEFKSSGFSLKSPGCDYRDACASEPWDPDSPKRAHTLERCTVS